MKVTCMLDYIELEGDHGGSIASVSTTCSRCDHTTESYGTSDSSIRRCLALLNEECPRNEDNFYTVDEVDD